MLPYRRFPLRLLLPSWWMAPWFLLLVGFCSSLFPEYKPVLASGIEWPIREGGLCGGGILQVNLPPLKPDAAQRESFKPPYDLPYLSAASLAKSRQWQTTNFTGSGIADFLNLAETQQRLRALESDTLHLTGVRIRFYRHASYGVLIEVMGALWAGEHKYWVDVRREPLTIYAVTLPPRP